MLPKVVIDSLVIFKWLYRADEKYLKQADKLLQDGYTNKIILLAPELAKYEVGNVLLVAKKLDLEKAKETLEFFYTLPVQFISETIELSKETYAISRKSGITFYDASFVALAKQEKAVLITDNPKHQQKFPGVKVIPLKDYQ